MTEDPGRHDVLPLNPIGAVLLGPGFVAAILRVYYAARLASPLPFAAAVQLAVGACSLVEEYLLLGDDLRSREISGSFSESV